MLTLLYILKTHSKKEKEFCTSHYIKESTVKTIVLDDLRRMLHLARIHELLFSKYLNKKSRSEVLRGAKSIYLQDCNWRKV